MLDAPYVLPKDLTKINRLDFQHYLLRQASKGNYLAPTNQPNTILDVACGTSIWGKEMAQTFPFATIIGLDLEQIKTTGELPPNYAFVQGNVLEALPFPDDHFEYVHQRLMVAGMPSAQWPGVIRELMRVTKPGGYLELVEAGIEGINLGPQTQAFFQTLSDMSLKRGLDARVIPHLGAYLIEAGLGNVQSNVVPIPIGKWGGRLGELMEKNLLTVLDGLKPHYPVEQFDARIRALPSEWKRYHTHYSYLFFWGQK
jgi:ubiquinone/menaquinone biosynthesis C-methylase UbiE